MEFLLKYRFIRYLVTLMRLIYFIFLKNNLKTINQSKNTINVTSERNRKSLLSFRDCYSGQRSEYFLNIFKSLSINQKISQMNVLVVGPRNEGELFNFYSKGFKPQNIDAFDLLSYSPKIKLLDINDKEIITKKYDLIYLGFMIAYQKNPKILINNLAKNLNNDGYLVVTGELLNNKIKNKSTFTTFNTLKNIQYLFNSQFKKVYLENYKEELYFFRENSNCYCGIFQI